MRTKKNSTTIYQNPFMVTSNKSYGISLDAQRAELEACEKRLTKIKDANPREGCHIKNKQSTQKHNSSSYDLSFLYSRESDRIGSGVEYSDAKLAKVLCEKISISEAKKKNRNSQGQMISPFQKKQPPLESAKLQTHQEIEKALEESYTHIPLEQNVLYTTSANDFGFKKPSAATYTAIRHARSQAFSNSYNKNMFQDQGLNTSLTRSNVHSHLDPQFV